MHMVIENLIQEKTEQVVGPLTELHSIQLMFYCYYMFKKQQQQQPKPYHSKHGALSIWKQHGVIVRKLRH